MVGESERDARMAGWGRKRVVLLCCDATRVSGSSEFPGEDPNLVLPFRKRQASN